MSRRLSPSRSGFSLMEIMVAVSIIGLMAAVASQQYFGSMDRARQRTCELNKAEIEVQVRRFHRHYGRWPHPTLSDIRRLPEFFPNGLHECPVDGADYRLNATTHDIMGHQH